MKSETKIEQNTDKTEEKTTRSHHWTAEELNLLKLHYGTMPNAELRRRFLPNRNIRAIGTKACHMGLSKPMDKRVWSQDEVELLAKHYDKLPIQEIRKKFFPNRSYQSITNMARQIRHNDRLTKPVNIESLHIKPADREFWTEDEHRLLVEHYGKMPIEELQAKYLPKRNLRSIRQMAYVMVPNRQPLQTRWTDEEIAILKANYGKMSVQDLRELLPNRTANAIQNTAQNLKLTMPRTPYWTDEEVKILSENAALSVAELQKLLPGRTESAIKQQRKRLTDQKTEK